MASQKTVPQHFLKSEEWHWLQSMSGNLIYKYAGIFNFHKIISAMLTLNIEKHVIYFDDKNTVYSSFSFGCGKKAASKEEAEKKEEEQASTNSDINQFHFQVGIQERFTWEWHSPYYRCQQVAKNYELGSCPLSLQHYLQCYHDPRLTYFRLTLIERIGRQFDKDINEEQIGKLIIKTSFKGTIFRLPVQITDKQNSKFKALCQQKILCIATQKAQKDSIICAAQFLEVQQYDQMPNFYRDDPKKATSYLLRKYRVNERVQAKNLVIIKGQFKLRQFIFDKVIIKIYTTDEDIFFMEGLMGHLQQLKIIMGEIEPLIIFQNTKTSIEDGYRTVFYEDSASLFHRVFHSYLYDKVKDKWIVQGMVYFNRSNKHFQDVIRQLIDLMTQGEQIVPLQEDVFHFDLVWRLKAIFFYHILSNFKNLRDYGSSSLANLIIEQSKKNMVTSQVLFRRLKNKYGLKNFRTIYEQQFVKSTGLNRIFYEIIDLKRENRVKIIVRQKALVNKIFRMYNFYRIKLQQEYDLLSDLSANIIQKNKILDKSNKKKEFSGPLAVPAVFKCLPYFKGSVSVQTDASQMPFQLQLKEQNIIQEKQNVTSKIRAPIRKIGEGEKLYEGFGWIMIDTAYVFPAFYKNQNVHQSVILEKIKKKYDSEHQEIKVLNCISSRDHSSNQKICRALIEKIKINTNVKENSTINVKRKILQILPVFLSKADDFTLWQDMFSFIKLYEPVCHDYSEDGYFFLLSLIESIGEIEYRKQFGYYFQNFHSIMIKILRTNNFRNEQKQLKLKMTIFNSLMKWKSCYSLQILNEIYIELKLCVCKVRASLQTLKILFKNIFRYIQSLKLNFNQTVETILKLAEQIIRKDKSYILFAIKFEFQLQQYNQQETHPLQFLKNAFGKLQDFRQQNLIKYGKALEVVKNIIGKHKKIYGLQLQLTLKQNQNYFIAQYIWKEMTSSLSAKNQFIRLQWIKIYRLFYFYFTPIITLKKIKENAQNRSFKELQPQEVKDILQQIRCFTPDIKWYSGYDSRSAKQLKAKYQQMNENKRKKKFQQYNFSENNVITLFIKQHPGRQTWDQLAREAIKTFIAIYEEKEQKSQGKEAQRHKHIQQGFKKVQQKLKRGRMPQFYNYQQLKEEIKNLMADFDQNQQKITDIFYMVDKALEEIAKQKARKEAEIKDEMKIVISFDNIQEQRQEQQEDQRQEQEGDDNQANEDDNDLMFRQEDNYRQEEKEQESNYNVIHEQEPEADQDLILFGQQK